MVGASGTPRAPPRMASPQVALDEAVATIDQALALESLWKNTGRSDDDRLEEILQLYQQSVHKLDDTMGDGTSRVRDGQAVCEARRGRAGLRRLISSVAPHCARDRATRTKCGSHATEAASMDAQLGQGEPGLLVDAVRLYSHAIRLMLRGAQDELQAGGAEGHRTEDCRREEAHRCALRWDR